MPSAWRHHRASFTHGQLDILDIAQRRENGRIEWPYRLSLAHQHRLVYSERAAERPATRLLRDWVKAVFAGYGPGYCRVTQF